MAKDPFSKVQQLWFYQPRVTGIILEVESLITVSFKGVALDFSSFNIVEKLSFQTSRPLI